MAQFDQLNEKDFYSSNGYVFYVCTDSELNDLKKDSNLYFRTNKKSEQFYVVDFALNPMSAIIHLLYHVKKCYIKSTVTDFNLIFFKPREVEGLKHLFNLKEAHEFDDGSMQLFRIQNVYSFKQCEMDSICVIKFKLDVSNMIEKFNSDDALLRQFGRFYDPIYGLESGMLKNILGFSTFQSLLNGELHFLDELSDNVVIEVASTIKHFLDGQGIDSMDSSQWPKMFILRLQKIYMLKNKVLNLEEL